MLLEVLPLGIIAAICMCWNIVVSDQSHWHLEAWTNIAEKFHLILNSLRFVHEGKINNYKSALVQVMAWHQTGDKQLCDPMMTPVHWCIYIYISRQVYLTNTWYSVIFHLNKNINRMKAARAAHVFSIVPSWNMKIFYCCNGQWLITTEQYFHSDQSPFGYEFHGQYHFFLQMSILCYHGMC